MNLVRITIDLEKIVHQSKPEIAVYQITKEAKDRYYYVVSGKRYGRAVFDSARKVLKDEVNYVQGKTTFKKWIWFLSETDDMKEIMMCNDYVCGVSKICEKIDKEVSCIQKKVEMAKALYQASM